MAIANPFVPLRTAGDQNGRGASVDVNRVQDLIKQALDLICAQITAQSSAAADIQPVFGPPLTDANDVKFIISDMVSGYKLPVQPLTANRTLSLDASGMGVNEDGWIVQI